MVKKLPKSAVKKHPLKIDHKSWNKNLCMAIVLERIATTSDGLHKILSAGYKGVALPKIMTIMEWLAESPELAEKYARARSSQADILADEILSISDDMSSDIDNPQSVQRARLQIDARKWLAGKLRPKKYGDRVDVAHSGTVEIDQRQRDAAVRASLIVVADEAIMIAQQHSNESDNKQIE